MGIKTVFNPMGGVRQQGEPYPPLDEWQYINDTTNDVRILQKYLGSATDIVVPYGHTILNDWVSGGTNDSVPFFNRSTITSVDLKSVPFINDSMFRAFYNDCNVVAVYNINKNITNMSYAFYQCPNFNQNIQIPSGVTSMNYAFDGCTNLNQNIQIPNSVTSMICTFYGCTNLNQNIQIPSSVTNVTSAFDGCTSLNQNIQIPNSVTSIVSTFKGCTSLNQNIQIPSSVTNISNAFRGCTNLNQNIQIPNSVTSMSNTFYSCTSLNQNIQIPSSVTNISNAFRGCTNLNQNIQIPSGVTSMSYTFYSCTNLNQNIRIPSGVTILTSTFDGCTSLNQNIQIPNSVTSIASTFKGCTNLNQNIQIPSSVTSVASAFSNCTALAQKTINILSYNITLATTCFNNTTATKQVWLPYRFINNTLSTTRNSFNSAGYIVGTGVGNSTINGCVMYDWVAGQGYPTYTGNGTHWVLGKWTNGSAPTEITVPNQILGYPTAITNTCFAANSSIAKLDISGVPVTSGTGTFENCRNLTLVKNLSQGEGTNYQGYFYNCQNLLAVTQDGSDLLTRTAHPYMPNTATSARAMYGHCKNIVNFYIDSYGVTTLYRTFNGVNTRAINVYINSPEVSNIAGAFTGYSSSYRKNIYIYFKYQNGVHTKTRNSFNVAVYKGSSYSEDGPWYNASSNFYVYNKGVCPI